MVNSKGIMRYIGNQGFPIYLLEISFEFSFKQYSALNVVYEDYRQTRKQQSL